MNAVSMVYAAMALVPTLLVVTNAIVQQASGLGGLHHLAKVCKIQTHITSLTHSLTHSIIQPVVH